jgi:hypothetical protein
MHRLRLLFAAACLTLASGCSKSAAEAAPAPPGDYGGYAAGGDAAGAATPLPAEEAEYARDDYGSKKNYDESPKVAAAELSSPPAPARQTAPSSGPTPAKPEPAPKEKTVSGGEGDDGKEPQKQFARQIIYTAEMVISCFKLEESMKRAEALTLETGGYIQTMSQGYFVLRIPAARLRGVMDELAKLGVVESRSLQAQDVTQEYVDLTTRIRVLKETQTQLIALLKQARNVEEALQVRRSLDAITMELEQAMGRLRMLENLIGFSTLTLRLSERGPQNAVPSSNDPFPWVDTLGVEATEWN